MKKVSNQWMWTMALLCLLLGSTLYSCGHSSSSDIINGEEPVINGEDPEEPIDDPDPIETNFAEQQARIFVDFADGRDASESHFPIKELWLYVGTEFDAIVCTTTNGVDRGDVYPGVALFNAVLDIDNKLEATMLSKTGARVHFKIKGVFTEKVIKATDLQGGQLQFVLHGVSNDPADPAYNSESSNYTSEKIYEPGKTEAIYKISASDSQPANRFINRERITDEPIYHGHSEYYK